MLLWNEFESEYHMPLLSNKPCFLLLNFFFFLLLLLLLLLFYKFISKEHLNEKGIHPFLGFAVR